MRSLANITLLPGEPESEVVGWWDELAPDRKEQLTPVCGSLISHLSLSPFLFSLAQAEIDWYAQKLGDDADTAFQSILNDLAALEGMSPEDVVRPLRQSKARMALLAGLAECGGLWSTARATAAMSEYADAVISRALDCVARVAVQSGKLSVPDGASPGAQCGLVIFALGKHGGKELNYSSDIDIVAFYEPGVADLAEPDEAGKFYARLVRQLVALLEERTAAGYVFRIDLRLRPDPGATPIALAMGPALHYYESRGQNWERAAWIKARPVAGDIKLGEGFLAELAPFIWRKHLDFAAISDIQAIKRQINLTRQVGEARLPGHNVKLGRGGIREIEFFAQTQQLIAGGRNPDLRVRPTQKALAQLLDANWISAEAKSDLTDAYWYLRAVENRLQMRRDEQTHSMPEDVAEITAVAAMMGEQSLESFRDKYLATIKTVAHHYADLFSESDSLASDIGNLVFTGSDDDPETLQTLEAMGFSDPEAASATVRKWHYGSYAATRASKAREHLTVLIPSLLQTVSEAGNADEALARFDNFLSRLPAGVQLFALLQSQDRLRRLLISFMASAPRLSEAVIRHVHIVDALISPDFSEDLNSATAVAEKVEDFLADAVSYEDLIDRARLVGKEQQFLISAGLLSGVIDAERAGERFSILAETLVGRLFSAVCEEFEKRHGRVAGARVTLLAFGKLASREMTATSDLDFILLYDAPPGAEDSDGEKSLSPPHYFTRLTQRLVAAISAPTAAGILYETDMRLRPSGNAGPLATPYSGFTTYQMTEAWTWEHLALTRARVMAGEPNFVSEVQAFIDEVVTSARDIPQTIDDVEAMRARLEADRKPRGPFDLKLASGGLIDLEFLAQSGRLVLGHRLGADRLTIAQTLTKMGELGVLPDAENLARIHGGYTTILQIMSVCLPNPFDEESWTDAFRALITGMLHYPDFERLKADIASMQADVLMASAAWYETARTLKSST